MTNSNEFLDREYPREHRGHITTLNLRGKSLEGHLDLSDFIDLTRLDCSNNQLTSIDLSKNEKLERLLINGNNIKSNLNIFSHLTNLKELMLGSKYSDNNHFYGSFEALKRLTKLEELFIGKNVYDENYQVADALGGVRKPIVGLEYLPHENLRIFSANGFEYYETILAPFGYDLKVWKLVNYSDMMADNDEELLSILEATISREQSNLIRANDSHRGNERDTIICRSKIELLEAKKRLIERFVEQTNHLENVAETHLEALDKAQEWRERQIKEITETKDQENKELESKIKQLETQITELTKQLEQTNLTAQIQIPPK